MRTRCRCSRRRGTRQPPTVGRAEVGERLAECAGAAARAALLVRSRTTVSPRPPARRRRRRRVRRGEPRLHRGRRPAAAPLIAARPADRAGPVRSTSRRRCRRQRPRGRPEVRPRSPVRAASRQRAERDPERRRGVHRLAGCGVAEVTARRPTPGQEVEPVGLVQDSQDACRDAVKVAVLQTIRFVCGSITTILWCQSSVIAIIPFGQRTASDGRSSEPGPRPARTSRRLVPPGVISSTRPGVLKPATRMLPSGSSCASDGYVVGVRTLKTRRPRAVEPVDPAADLGDEHAAVGQRRRAVRRGEPCGAGRGRTTPAPPISRTMRCRADRRRVPGSCGCRRP